MQLGAAPSTVGGAHTRLLPSAPPRWSPQQCTLPVVDNPHAWRRPTATSASTGRSSVAGLPWLSIARGTSEPTMTRFAPVPTAGSVATMVCV